MVKKGFRMTLIRQAELCDLPAVLQLYRQLCDQQAQDTWTPLWEFGLHPSEEMLEGYVRNGELWLAEADGEVAGAMVLTEEEGSLGLHLLGILKSFRRTGLSGKMMDHMEQEARSRGIGRLCLDVIAGNLPAEQLYIRRGFSCIGTSEDVTEKGTPLHFHLYEKFM